MNRDLMRARVVAAVLVCAVATTAGVAQSRQATLSIPTTPLTFGAFSAQFRGDGTFSLTGEGWPAMRGTWTVNGSDIVLQAFERAG